MVSSARMCLICKGGRAMCGHNPCPLLPRLATEKRLGENISKEVFGPSHSLFVGRIGYPNVYMGPMIAMEERPGMDTPKSWLGMDYSKIIELQGLLLRSKQKEGIKSQSRLVLDSQDLILAKKPTDVEMSFKKKPVYSMTFSDIVQPMGPSATLEKMRVAENPKISRKVDRIVSDELKSADASFELYKTGQDVHKVSAILSSGILGMERAKKLVPTRWSVTASQTIIANKLIEKIKELPSINEYRIYSSQKLDNRFEILLMPGDWEFENFEAWAPGSFWSKNLKQTEIIEEYEPYEGRKKYAQLQGGGFYSSRFGVCEGLLKIKKQARAMVFREIYEGYSIPVGCWQIVENVRNAFNSKYEKFSTRKEALETINNRLRLPISEYKKKSIILGRRILQDFI